VSEHKESSRLTQSSHNCLKSGGSCGYGMSNPTSPSLELSEEDVLPWSPIEKTLNPVWSNSTSDPFQPLGDLISQHSVLLFDQGMFISRTIRIF